MPIDREGKHRCWLCDKVMESGRTVIFTRIGFVEFICQTCYDRPNIRDILQGRFDRAQPEMDISEIVKFEPKKTPVKAEKELLEEFKKY